MTPDTGSLDALRPGAELRLELYVAGGSQRGLKAMADLRKLVDERRVQGWTLEVVDVRTEPERAEAALVRMTPTVVCGERRAVGSFGDARAILEALGIPA